MNLVVYFFMQNHQNIPMHNRCEETAERPPLEKLIYTKNTQGSNILEIYL